MPRFRGLIKTALAAKAIQLAQRELAKPENQRRIKEGLSKIGRAASNKRR